MKKSFFIILVLVAMMNLIHTSAYADDINLTGVWKFSTSETRLFLLHENDKVIGHFESINGKWMYDVKGIVDSDGDIEGVRYIPQTEFQGRGIHSSVFNELLGEYPSDKIGFMAGKIEFDYDRHYDELDGFYHTYSVEWSGTPPRLTDVIEKEVSLTCKRVSYSFFSPTKTRKVMRKMEEFFASIVNDAKARGKLGIFVWPRAFIEDCEYRLGLIRRYLKIDEIYVKRQAVEFPGAGTTKIPKFRSFSVDDLTNVAMVYGSFLTMKRPQNLAPHAAMISWKDVNGSKIYFGSAQEESALNMNLAYLSTNEVRRHVKVLMKALLKGGVLGPTCILPGGAIPMDIYILVTGENLYGKKASGLEKVLAVLDLGMQSLPVAAGVYKASVLKASKQPMHPLMTELLNRNNLRSQLQPTNNINVREAMMTRWLSDLDDIRGLRSRPLVTSKASVSSTTGAPLAQRGIDAYVVPKSQPRSIGMVREYKRSADFAGDWSKPSNLSLKISVGVKIPGIHTSQLKAGQLSWSWIIDRAIKAHRYGIENKLPTQTAAARDLLVKFLNNKLHREIVVMNNEGSFFVSKPENLARLCPEAQNPTTGKTLTIPDLQRAVSKYLAENIPIPTPTNVKIKGVHQ